MSTNDMMMTMHAVPGDELNAQQIHDQQQAETTTGSTAGSRNRTSTINLAENWRGIFEEIAQHAISERIIEEIPQAGRLVPLGIMVQ